MSYVSTSFNPSRLAAKDPSNALIFDEVAEYMNAVKCKAISDAQQED